VLAEYVRRYANPVTREQNRQRLDDLFRACGRTRPAEVTEGDLVEWITAVPANNSVRGRLSAARTFFRWCMRAGVVARDPTLDLEGLTKQYPKTYGKVQGHHQARWLTYEEAYGELLGACRDGSWAGVRDELAIRLGLLGVRSAEASRLTWGNVGSDGRLHWIGKGRRDRSVTPGLALRDLIGRWRPEYQARLGRPLSDGDPLLCPEVLGAGRQGGPRRVDFGRPLHPAATTAWSSSGRPGPGSATSPPMTCVVQPRGSCTAWSVPTGGTCTTCSTSSRCWTTPIRPLPSAATSTP
jgi:integrase